MKVNGFNLPDLFFTGAAGDLITSAGVPRISGAITGIDNSVLTRVAITGALYTGLATDHVIEVRGASGLSPVIVLPTGLVTSKSFIIKDGSGTAGLANSSIRVSGLPSIDGVSLYTMQTNWESITVYTTAQAGWRII